MSLQPLHEIKEYHHVYSQDHFDSLLLELSHFFVETRPFLHRVMLQVYHSQRLKLISSVYQCIKCLLSQLVVRQVYTNHTFQVLHQFLQAFVINLVRTQLQTFYFMCVPRFHHELHHFVARKVTVC